MTAIYQFRQPRRRRIRKSTAGKRLQPAEAMKEGLLLQQCSVIDRVHGRDVSAVQCRKWKKVCTVQLFRRIKRLHRQRRIGRASASGLQLAPLSFLQMPTLWTEWSPGRRKEVIAYSPEFWHVWKLSSKKNELDCKYCVKIRHKIDILNSYSLLCRKLAAVCRKVATSCSQLFNPGRCCTYTLQETTAR